jgi:phosphoribosylformimino-5-aminoimidazole carboxamide ribotide isomerase
MLIIPAIDLQEGSCVRLKQGQFEQVTHFSVDPIQRAAYFASIGAKRLHVVDLDGAKTGLMQQLPLICSMQKSGIPVQAGGGIRTLAQAKECLSVKLSRLVLGSIAITDPALTQQIIQEITAERTILALDVRIEQDVPTPATHGWQKAGTQTLWDVVTFYQELGIKEILCTDIACDGMMAGPNFKLYQEAVTRFPNISWQASGGIRDQDDIEKLSSLGIAAAILGLTLYQNTFNLADLM